MFPDDTLGDLFRDLQAKGDPLDAPRTFTFDFLFDEEWMAQAFMRAFDDPRQPGPPPMQWRGTSQWMACLEEELSPDYAILSRRLAVLKLQAAEFFGEFDGVSILTEMD